MTLKQKSRPDRSERQEEAVSPSRGQLRDWAPAPSRGVAWILLGILAFAFLTALIFHTGLYASDDLGYVAGAVELAESGRMTTITMGTKRLGIVLPLAMVAKLSGGEMFAMTASFALYHLLLVVGAFAVGKLVHGDTTGLIAAFILATSPLAAAFATMILPDHAATAWTLCAMALLIAGMRRPEALGGSKTGLWMLIGAGLMSGIAIISKDTGIIALPPFLIFILVHARTRPIGPVARLVAGFLAGLTTAGVLYFICFRLATGLWSPLADPAFAEKFLGFADRAAALPYGALDQRWDRLVNFGTSTRHLGFFKWLLPLSLVIYPLMRRRSWFIYLMFFWLCFYMTYGTFSLTRYTPPPMQIRYFILPLPLAVLMTAYIAAEAGRFIWRRVSKKMFVRAVAGLWVVVGILWIANAYGKLNNIAGSPYLSPEVSATRYALDFAASSERLPVVLSYWLSARVGRTIPADGEVVLTNSDTSLAEVADLLGPEGFVYLDWEREREVRRPSPRTLSPLDEMVRKARVEPLGRIKVDPFGVLQVRTLGAFSQFQTRFGALAYVYAGSSDFTLTPRYPTRRVFIRQVSVVPEALEMDDAVIYDFSEPNSYEPAWVYRVEEVELQALPDRSLSLRVVGSDETGGGQYAGVKMEVGPIRAVRLDVTFHQPEDIKRVFLDLTAGSGPRERLRWMSLADPRLLDGRQSYLFALDRQTSAFTYRGGKVPPEEIDHLQFFIQLEGLDAQTGFNIERMMIWPHESEV